MIHATYPRDVGCPKAPQPHEPCSRCSALLGDEACHAVRVAADAVGSYPTFSPLPPQICDGGSLSVALSVA